MPKIHMLNRFLAVGFLALTVVGCQSLKGVETRGYVMDQPRVDQQLEGNAGYIFGTPQFNPPEKETRRVFVVEVSKEAEVPDELMRVETETITQETVSPAPRPPARQVQQAVEEEPLRLPSFDDPRFAEEEPRQQQTSIPKNTIEYTVQKSDTLQKISKQFYDTYRKWPQIYEANRDRMSDPNKLKEGMVLRIPVED